MNKIRDIGVYLLIPLIFLIAFIFLRIKAKGEFQQKVVLAQETRKALEHLMVDIYQARKGSFEGVPADGLWHHRVAFDRGGQGVWEYFVKDGQLFRVSNGDALLIADDISDLRIRRQKDSSNLLEVQIEAQKNVSLISNFKIRIQP